MKAIITEQLSKAYTPEKKAVDRISITIDQGEVFGFLGPNGAGKTSTVKLLNGMLSPTEGSCRILGFDPNEQPEKMHSLAGVVTEHAQMYDNLTGLQNLIFYGKVFGMTESDSQTRAKDLLERLELLEAANRKLSAYSTGMRQRLSLARALIHRPQILFLDEPTSGLDPESAQSVNCLIKSLASDGGTTVFLCTHQLRYAQEICTTYGLINDGRLLADGNLEQLRKQVFSGMTVNIKADYFPDHLHYTKTNDSTYEIKVGTEDEIPRIVREIVSAGGNVYQVSARHLSLEEIYFSLIEARKTGKGDADD